MPDGIKTTLSINLVTHAAHPEKVTKGNDKQSNNKDEDWQERQHRTQYRLPVRYRSYCQTPRNTTGSSLRRTMVWLYQNKIPSRRLQPSPGTSVTRIGDGYRNDSPQKCKNKKGYSYEEDMDETATRHISRESVAELRLRCLSYYLGISWRVGRCVRDTRAMSKMPSIENHLYYKEAEKLPCPNWRESSIQSRKLEADS